MQLIQKQQQKTKIDVSEHEERSRFKAYRLKMKNLFMSQIILCELPALKKYALQNVVKTVVGGYDKHMDFTHVLSVL